MKKKILIIFGTRPEAIKLAPLILALRKEKALKTTVCVTAQHRQMLDQVLPFFKIGPDIDLNIMKHGQSIEELTAAVFSKLTPVIKKASPDMVIVQGDTTTAFMSALAAFYRKIPVGHVEAGLRTHDIYAPFPEELNRQFVSRIAQLNFAPTESAVKDLLAEGVNKSTIYKTGNTVVDAMKLGMRIIKTDKSLRGKLESRFHNVIDMDNSVIAKRAKLILITGHRRESFGKGFQGICAAIKELSYLFPSYLFVYPVHPNPNVQKPVYKLLGKINNVKLIKPVNYPEMLFLMSKSHLILTDSGGIQEEAPSLKIPVLVTRDKTERPEGVQTGCCKLVGNDKDKIVKTAKRVLSSTQLYRSMQRGKNPYGDGKASERIVRIIKKNV